jgi:TatD DNase family protein
VTFPKADNLSQVAQNVPADRLLVETDCPYLSPVPNRGKRNEPSFVVDTARFVAALRNVGEAELAESTSGNFKRLFGE